MYEHDYFFQLTTYLIPEITLTVIISYMLTIIAVELGRGASKSALGLESLGALQTGLLSVAVLYTLQLIGGNAELLFNGYLMTTDFIVALKLLTTLSAWFVLSSSRLYMWEHPRHLLEYPVVLSIAVLFMLFLIGSSHLITAFLSIIGFSLSLYVLILFDAPTSIAREGGIKYFYLSTFSSGLMIYGIFIVFLVFRTGHMTDIRYILALHPEIVAHSENYAFHGGLIFLLVGLFFKLSAFPGHLWAAEVYDGSPDPITAFFMVPVKVAVLAFVLQLLVTLETAYPLWQPLLAVSALGSLLWGCFAALVEMKTKRFFAYASINQIGFLLLGVATNSDAGHKAALLYLLIYAIMNVGLLTVFLHARRSDGRNLMYLNDFKDLGRNHWYAAWTLAVVLFSMAGIPPLAGFYGKYYLLLHAQEQGLHALVIAGLVTSLVSTYYYIRLIRMFWFEKDEGLVRVRCYITPTQWLSVFAVEGFLWFFTFFAEEFLCMSEALSLSLNGPLSYT